VVSSEDGFRAMLRPPVPGVILIMNLEVNDSAGRSCVGKAEVSIAAVSGQPSPEASTRKSVPVSDGRVSASDENESQQGGENDDGTQYVQHVHGCRLCYNPLFLKLHPMLEANRKQKPCKV
jgi:hypothetical protein